MSPARALPFVALASSGGLAALSGALAIAGPPGERTVPVQTEPSGASVFVDGLYAGRAPVAVGLGPRAARSVRVEKSGHRTRFARLGPDGASPLRLRLAPLPVGGLTVGSEPPGAEVIVDGVFLGVTPLVDEPVPAGPHAVRLERPNHVARTVSVLVEPGGTASLRLELADRVLAFLERAAEARPDDVMTLMELAHHYVVAGRPEDSARVYRRAIELSEAPGATKLERRKLQLQIRRDRQQLGEAGRRMGAELERLREGEAP